MIRIHTIVVLAIALCLMPACGDRDHSHDQPGVHSHGDPREERPTVALTHWTDPASLPAPDTDAGEVTGRDGRSVARGGAGQKTPGFVSGGPQEANGLGGRKIFYDKTSTALANLNVDSAIAAALAADFGVSTVSEAEELIAFSRGLDIDDLDGDSDTAEAREWIFGDAPHSRPLPINYGAIGGYTDPDNPAISI